MTAQDRIQMLEAMLAEEPKDAELRYALAMEYASGGDDAGAVRCFQELIEVVPHYPPAYHQAGRALQRLDRMPEARAVLSQGIPIAQAQGNQHAAGEMMELLQSLE